VKPGLKTRNLRNALHAIIDVWRCLQTSLAKLQMNHMRNEDIQHVRKISLQSAKLKHLDLKTGHSLGF